MTSVWKIAPGQRADNWDICRKHGCIVVGWGDIGNFQKYKNEKEVLKALKRAYGKEKGCGAGAARTIWRFVNAVEPPDVIVANKGESIVVGIGRVKSEYLPPEHPKNPVPVPGKDEWWRRNARLVDWSIRKPIDLHKKHFFVASTIQHLTRDQCDEIKQAYLNEYPEFKVRLDELFSSASSSADDHELATKNLLDAAEKQLAGRGAFDPTGTSEDRERILSSIVRRRGQPAFRKQLLAAYQGRCAITGCDVEEVLEAAHIVPYNGPKTNHSANGLLLRADLHTLFDLGLMAVDVETMRLLVSSTLQGTSYESYRGKRIKLPKQLSSQPSRVALEHHCRECGLIQ